MHILKFGDQVTFTIYEEGQYYGEIVGVHWDDENVYSYEVDVPYCGIFNVFPDKLEKTKGE